MDTIHCHRLVGKCCCISAVHTGTANRMVSKFVMPDFALHAMRLPAGALDEALLPQPDHKQAAQPCHQAYIAAKSTAQVAQMLLQLAAQERAADEAEEDLGLIRQRYLAWLSKPCPLDSRESPTRQRPTCSTGSQNWLVHAPSSMLAAAAPIADKQLRDYTQHLLSGTCSWHTWEAAQDVKRLSYMVWASNP